MSDDLDFSLLGDEEPLSEKDLTALNEALMDGFSSVALVPDHYVLPMTGLVNDRFWDTAIIASEQDIARFEEMAAEFREEGFDHEHALDAWLDLVEGNMTDGAPEWRESNPFGFDLPALKTHFHERCNTGLGDLASSLRTNGGDETFGSLSLFFEPFTRQWFELRIAHEIWLLEGLFDQCSKRGDVAAFWVSMLFSCAGKIGRMVESYRWRFAYGDHALRGKRTKEAASEGGIARSSELSAQTKATLDEMNGLIKQGKSLSDAARFAFKNGFGTSANANRALWYAHRRRNMTR
ncbi:hypothetical protein IWQ48_001079 [Labrenzia sp. EL_13]|nr:hypothetical protein [Labrenzia sp. EL_13]